MFKIEVTKSIELLYWWRVKIKYFFQIETETWRLFSVLLLAFYGDLLGLCQIYLNNRLMFCLFSWALPLILKGESDCLTIKIKYTLGQRPAWSGVLGFKRFYFTKYQEFIMKKTYNRELLDISVQSGGWVLFLFYLIISVH